MQRFEGGRGLEGALAEFPRKNPVTGIAGGSGAGYAVTSDGHAWAWGNNYDGQLGNGTTTYSTTPVQVSGLTGVTAIAGGSAVTSP